MRKIKQKQIRTTVETIDFAEMTGEKPPQTCREFIAQHDFTYRRLDHAETAQIVKNIKRDLQRDSYIRAGIDRQQDWEKGWQENLVVYRQTRDIEDLIPRYYRKTEILRYQGKYIKPADAEFQLNIMRAILLWLGESHITHVLYEFGCGSGYNLAYLNKHFPSKRYCGLDWAKSSQAIMNELGFLGGEFDLMSPDHSLQLEPNSTVLTFGALEQIGREHTAFIDYLLTQPIAKAIHIEPIIELYCLGSKADRLAKIYAEKRGYLQGFLTALRNHKGIRIRECRKLIGDRNQDCWSLIIWEKESNGS